jgi:hypothetical protein
MDGLYVATALMRTSSSRPVHLRSENGCEQRGRGSEGGRGRADLGPSASSEPVALRWRR